MRRGETGFCALALAMLALLTALAVTYGRLTGSALAAPPAVDNTTTTIPDDTYGAGGTKESIVNAKREVLIETWRDKSGYIRERFELGDDGAQYWGFLQGEGQNTSEWGGTIAVKPLARPADRWEMTVYGPGFVTLKEYGFLSRADLDEAFDYWHRQMRGWVNGFINPRAPG